MMFPNVIMGRLTALQFRQKTVYMDGDNPMGMDVMRVHFVAPNDESYYHDLPNNEYTLNNKALQFMAKWGYQPTDLGNGTHYDAYEDQKLLPIVYVGETEHADCEYALAQTALKRGESLLESAEWFAPHNESDEHTSQSATAHGGSDDDGGSPTTIEQSEKDGVGMNVVVE